MLRVTDSDVFKILPTLYDGDILPYRSMRFIYISNKIYYIECPIVYSSILEFKNLENNVKFYHGYRYFYNVYHNDKVDFITVGKSLADIISKDVKLYDINSNSHLKVITNDVDGGNYRFKDYRESHRIDIEWNRPDVDNLSKWLSENNSSMNKYIESNILKDISILGEDFVSIYNDIVSKKREDKLNKLIDKVA